MTSKILENNFNGWCKPKPVHQMSHAAVNGDFKICEHHRLSCLWTAEPGTNKPEMLFMYKHYSVLRVCKEIDAFTFQWLKEKNGVYYIAL